MIKHNGYLDYELPNNWIAEEDSENIIIYDPKGNGAMTISFFNVFNVAESLDEEMSILAKKFIDKNSIDTHSPLILLKKDDKTMLRGAGTTEDGWYIKIWIVAKYPKIVFVTYQSEKSNKEVKICNMIVDSFKFLF